MFRFALAQVVLAGLCGCGSVLAVTNAWLVVAGSNTAVEPAMSVRNKLVRAWPTATIISTGDCENLRAGLYLTVVDSGQDREKAQAVLSRLKPGVADAYVRQCKIKPDSRIALGVPLIDPSIEKVPQNVVNWTDHNRISSVAKLADGGYLWIRRRYESLPEDPREGRREAVLFFETSPSNPRQLESDCTDPEFDRRGTRLAVGCARETAADHLLHNIQIFSIGPWEAVQAVPHCRKPHFVSAYELSCSAEEIDSSGGLKLTQKLVSSGSSR
jgi:hypothetical protein